MRSTTTESGAPRRITLDADGLDRLEQVLLGAAPLAGLSDLLGGNPDAVDWVQLHDGENTPLADVRHGKIAPLQPLAQGVGAQWDPSLRRSAEALRLAIDPTTPTNGSVIAFAAHTPPSSAELEAVVNKVAALGGGRSGGGGALIMAALVSRAAHQTGRVGAAGLTRSLLAASRALAPRLPNVDIQTIVIPWPLREVDGAPDRRAEALHLLRAYGATETLFGGEQQQLSDADLAAVLPEASLQEVQRARSTKWSRPAVILFTGLSGSGKSTIARGLVETLRDEGATEVVLLDGDEMRRRISADLGFDRASRNANVERIAHAAAEIAKGGGIAIAAPIAPFREGRARAREIATAVAPYILVHVSTPLEVCESRDRKGLYAKARAGEVKEFTGISSPYEAPDDADLVIDASRVTIKAAVEQVKALIRS